MVAGLPTPVTQTGSGCCSGARPDIDRGELREFPVPGERLDLPPGAQDEPQILLVAVAHLDRRHAVIERRVEHQPDREAGHQPAARDAVDHRVFLGDADRLARLAERPADREDRDVEPLGLGGIADRRADQARIGGHVVGGLGVLGEGDAVETEPGRLHDVVEIVAERRPNFRRLGERVRRGHGTLVPVLEIGGKFPVLVLRERHDLHGSLPWLLRTAPEKS